MPDGIRATVAFDTASICPIVELSAAAETTVDSIATTVCPGDCSGCATEFWLDSEPGIETDAAAVFSQGSMTRYRLSHGDEVSCPCECLGRLGCPVASYTAQGGRLRIVFHATDYDELQTAVGRLRSRFPDIDIKRFVRSPDRGRSRDSVLVDRGKLTARQREVLEVAYENGYFERPRRANASELADELDISPSTFREHITAAESKLFGDIV